jgi:hypothetical protein
MGEDIAQIGQLCGFSIYTSLIFHSFTINLSGFFMASYLDCLIKHLFKMKQILFTAVLVIFCFTTFAQAKKIIILSPQVSIDGNIPKSWSDTSIENLKLRLAGVYQAQAAQRFAGLRNRRRFRNRGIQIITLSPNDAVPVGNDVAYVVAPKVMHTIYMRPQDAMAINAGIRMMNWNSPLWMPYVQPNSSGSLLTIYEGNTRSVLQAGRYFSNRSIKRMFKRMF